MLQNLFAALPLSAAAPAAVKIGELAGWGCVKAWVLVAAPAVLSFALFVAAFGLLIYSFVRSAWEKHRRVFPVSRFSGQSLLIFSLLLLLSVWLLRLGVERYVVYYSGAKTGQCLSPEAFFNSILQTLQTFSLDAAYDTYLKNGQEMLTFLGWDGVTWAFDKFSALMNAAAPLAGGAFVLELLASIFPQVKYYWMLLFYRRSRYFFTALNQQSLAMAKSIVCNPSEKNPVLIFTDAYADKENEEKTELLLSAKALGAICLKDDLLHIPLLRLGSKEMSIFISDRTESQNLETLSQLTDIKKQKKLEKTRIYVFGTDKKMSHIEDEVTYLNHRLSAEFAAKKTPMKPGIIPVNGIRNMAQNLFFDLPLFEGLYEKDRNGTADPRDLHVTIIGSGAIGTELFLNAVWFGQMTNVRLNLNVVSKSESKSRFVSRIDAVCPEIMRSAAAGDPLLNAGLPGAGPNPQPPYFRFRFENADVLTGALDKLLEKGVGDDDDRFPLRDTDYFIVAAGSDEDNFRIADLLKNRIGRYHMEEAPEKKTVISYVIYNSDLCNTLNVRSRLDTAQGKTHGKFDIYMHAFGSMEEIFCRRNLLFDEVKEVSERIGKKYGRDEENNLQNPKKYYNQRANNARALHVRYKAYCAGWLGATLFDTLTDADYRAGLKEAEFDYWNKMKQMQQTAAGQETARLLAWTEHRRWNAFMRMNGFTCPADWKKYESLNNDIHNGAEHDYRFLFFKLHPCITEAAPESFKIALMDGVRVDPVFEEMKPEDRLDEISREQGIAFKKYDYPEGEFDVTPPSKEERKAEEQKKEAKKHGRGKIS